MAGATVAWPYDLPVQRAEKVYKIGVLSAGSAAGVDTLHGMLRDGLREFGWIEGKNFAFEDRSADDDRDRLPVLAAELVRFDVDVIVGLGTLAPLAAKWATSTIPIVMAVAGKQPGRSGRHPALLARDAPPFMQYLKQDGRENAADRPPPGSEQRAGGEARGSR